MGKHWRVTLMAFASIITSTAFGAASACPGDCDGGGKVELTELTTAVSIALRLAPYASCPAFDSPTDEVTAPDLVRAVAARLHDCGAVSASPTASPTPTNAPEPTQTPIPPTTPVATSTAPITPGHFCELPGSVQTTAPGIVIVPGGPPNAPDLRFMKLPIGFCAHFFANVGNARQLRFAPGGDLFVASPTTITTGGGPSGKSAIVVLPDDDHDGVADEQVEFMNGLPSTQGLLFANGSLYYQDLTKIMRVPFAPGDRSPSGASEEVLAVVGYNSTLHWPKLLDIADDGTIYVSNGGDQNEICDDRRPFHGGILAVDGTANGRQVTRGFRNPIAVRCSRGHNLCFAVELAKDFTASTGGREKLMPIRDGDDWGFPCCATTNVPYDGIIPRPDCSQVAFEAASFLIGDTPFDLDFETGKWPAPWGNRAYIPLHGEYTAWEGARLVAIEQDAMTGNTLPGSDLPGQPPGGMLDFATGWGDRKKKHGRPAAIAFAPDGRLFLGNDNNGDIIWIAPLDL